MKDTRGVDRGQAQRRRLLTDTIGRHAFAGRQIERRLRAESLTQPIRWLASAEARGVASDVRRSNRG